MKAGGKKRGRKEEWVRGGGKKGGNVCVGGDDGSVIC